MKTKILIVEDSEMVRLIVKNTFKSFECELWEASDGSEGLFVASKHKPDIIILDYTMPVMDGDEMLSRLKCDPELRHIPIMMLAEEAHRKTVAHLVRMGVCDYLIKPFKEELLIDRVSRILDLKSTGEPATKVKRFYDALSILVVDDKPKILEQIQLGLAQMNWSVQGCSQISDAFDHCFQRLPDLILVNLLLGKNDAFDLFQMLRSNVQTKEVLVFGLCVKTETEVQARALQMGFPDIINKPIDFEDLKRKISRALVLDNSCKYFEQQNDITLLRCPESITAFVAKEISTFFSARLTETIDAGFDKFVMDFSKVKKPDMQFIKLVLHAIRLCQELSVKYQLVGSEALRQECVNYEESVSWSFANSLEEATAIVNGRPMVSAGHSQAGMAEPSTTASMTFAIT